VITKAALLTRILKVDQRAKVVLLNIDVVVADAVGLVSHNGRTVWLPFCDGDWEAESQRIHAKVTELLEKQLNTTGFFGSVDPKLDADAFNSFIGTFGI
jgi:hypothetical protein